MRKKICAMVAFLSLALCACSAEEGESIRISSIEELAETTGSEEMDVQTEVNETGSVDDNAMEFDSKGPESGETADSEMENTFDVWVELNEAEEAAAALEKKLYEDASLSQTDMNDLTYEIYMVWDGVLNDLWQVLKDSLDEETMDSLLEEQRTWITEKEKEVKQTGENAGGGSMAILVSNQRAAKLTKTRVYELATYLGYVGTSQESGNSVLGIK